MDSSVTLAEDLGDKDRLECNTLEKERKQLKYKQRERDTEKEAISFRLLVFSAAFALTNNLLFFEPIHTNSHSLSGRR